MVKRKFEIIILAIILSISTWYIVTGRDLVETWIDFPLEVINPPHGMIIKDGMISKVSVRLRGPKGLIRNLDKNKIAYSLDTSNLVVGKNPIDIVSSNLGLGSALSVVEIKPSHIDLLVDMYVEKKIPVDISWQGDLNYDYILKSKKCEPNFVTLKGPESVLQEIKVIKTQKVLIKDNTLASWKGAVPLSLPSDISSSPETVNVDLKFTVRMAKMWIKIPLYVLSPEDVDFGVSQNYVRLLVEGPKPFFRKKNFRNDITASIDLDPDIDVGKYEIPYSISLPEGCSVVKKKPESITVTITK